MLIINQTILLGFYLVLLCANGVRSALTVSTSVTSSLTFLNSCFLVVIGLVELRDIMLLSLHSERSKTIELLWPTNAQMKEIVEFGPQVSSWVNTIHNAQNAILASLLVIPSMRSYEDLKKALDQVEICYEEAARSDHLLMVRHFVV